MSTEENSKVIWDISDLEKIGFNIERPDFQEAILDAIKKGETQFMEFTRRIIIVNHKIDEVCMLKVPMLMMVLSDGNFKITNLLNGELIEKWGN